MDANAKGLWLLPTFNRPTTNLPRFFEAAMRAGMTTPGVVVVDEADHAKNAAAYDTLALPEHWSILVVPGGCCRDATEQALARVFTADMEWVGWLADDLVPVTQDWDKKCIEALTGWNCVSTDDGKYAPQKFNGATVWSGDLVRAVGYLFPQGLKHFFIDNVWEELHKITGIWECRMDILVRHDHGSWTNGLDATLAHTNSFWAYDDSAFIVWKEQERLAAAARIGELLLRYGVAQPLPDLSGVNVMIGTPMGAGRPELVYLQSLYGTVAGLRECGASVNTAFLPYCSDIALARSKIFGMFHRSSCTHLLSIDDDMGWRPQDVIRLFTYQRDFVAAAGPRKVFPPSFAVQNSDGAGRAMPMRQEAATGLFEVSDIGMAFALASKNWANRMADAYRDLEYSGDDGRPEYAIFNPIVVHRRYKSEDFAACHRWRAIGGKVYVDPTISLKHVGAHVWEGDWLTHLLHVQAGQQHAA